MDLHDLSELKMKRILYYFLISHKLYVEEVCVSVSLFTY